MIVGNFSFMLAGDKYLKNPLIQLPKLTRISCKAFGYGVISDPFHDPRGSKKEKMEGIDALKKYMSSSNIFVYVGGKYLKKTSHLVVKSGNYIM